MRYRTEQEKAGFCKGIEATAAGAQRATDALAMLPPPDAAPPGQPAA